MPEIERKVIDEDLYKFYKKLESSLINVGSPVTQKNNSQTKILSPFVDRDIARYLFYNCTDLRRCITVYTKDLILNEYSIENPEAISSMKLVDATWNKDSTTWQLWLAGLEHEIYGYGLLEVIEDKPHQYHFQQIPAYTVEIETKTFTDTNTDKKHVFYYAKQTINGQETYLRISHLNYQLLDKNNTDDGSEGICLWIGGGNEHEFYSVPQWINEIDNIFTSLAINRLNSDKIQHGNIPAGVMMFQGPTQLPDPEFPEQERIDKQLEQDLQNGSGGTIFTYLENNSTSRDITMQYQALTDNNYEYLESLQRWCQIQIRKCIGVPTARLLEDDAKESMNSHKTDKLYEIYIEELRAAQMFIKQIINNFNRKYLHVYDEVVISTPEFVDKLSTKIESIIKLFNYGLFTLGDALTELTEVYPELDLKNDIDEEMLNMRFYGGKLLGDTSNDEIAYDNVIEDLNKFLVDDGYSKLQVGE